eukprot:7390711-Prymnesium_polylepis.3
MKNWRIAQLAAWLLASTVGACWVWRKGMFGVERGAWGQKRGSRIATATHQRSRQCVHELLLRSWNAE